MNEQLSIEYPGEHPRKKHRATGPDTSRRAAYESFPRHGIQRHRVLLAIADSPAGLTYDAVSTRTGIVGVSVSGRLTELARGGWIELAGEKRTANGGPAAIWVATEKAQEHLNGGA